MDPPPELEGYSEMRVLEEGQQIILELPQEGETGSDSVIMEVVSVDGNQIHFIAPDKFSMEEVGLSGKYAITADTSELSGVTDGEGTVKFSIPGVGEDGAEQIALPEVGPAKFDAGVEPGTSAIEDGQEVEEIRMPDVGSIQDDDAVEAVAGQEGLESEVSRGKDKLVTGEVDGGTAEELGPEADQEGGEGEGVDHIGPLPGPVTGDGEKTSGDEQDELEEIPTPTCFLCRRPSPVITYLLRGRTDSCSCSLAERLSSCLAPVKLSYTTADAVCGSCQALINAADAHYFQFQESSREIRALLEGGAEPHPSILSSRPKPEPAEPVETNAATMQQPLLVPANYRPKRRKPSPRGDGDDSADSDWTPSRDGSPPRTSRGRRPKTRCLWSPEPKPAPPPGKRRPGRPRKHPVVDLDLEQPAPAPAPAEPKVIEYTDLETLKQQVKDIKTKKFSMNPLPRTLKSDLEKIIHLEVRTVDDLSAPDDAAEVEKSPGRAASLRAGDTYECRRCNIQFRDSDEMVKHLQRHVSKPWCKRCRTEFPDRAALLDHRRACRLQHRAGICSICNKEVPYHRHHMKRHAELVDEGRLMEGEPLPEEEDGPPPSLQRASGKLLAGGVCSICGEHVASRLRKHERSHSATNTCPICKKVFARDDVVRGHISRVHLKERPHVCPQCGKTFVSVFSLQRHEMIHNNEYRFYCQECGDGFRQKQQLTAHMRHKHGVLDVVFEDVQVMPEGTAVVDAMSVVADSGVGLAGGVLEALDDKGEFVIATAGSGDEEDEVRYTVTDAAGRMYRVATADAEALTQE